MWIKIVDGSPAGLPCDKPQSVVIPATSKQPQATVKCGHWPAEELAKLGWYPVDGEYDPEYHTLQGATELAPGVYSVVVTNKDVRKETASYIDTLAEDTRLVFITPGSGQAMTYQRKLEEARELTANGAGPFPLLEASVGPDGADVAAVAAKVIAQNESWSTIGAVIEKGRLNCKAKLAEDNTKAKAIKTIATAFFNDIRGSEGNPQLISDSITRTLADLSAV